MVSLKVYATVAGLALAASATTVRAADLLSGSAPPPAPVESFGDAGGWYLRGDVGVGSYSDTKWTSSEVGTRYYNTELGSAAFAGAGIGYQFNSWFRTDVTGEYRFSTGASGIGRYDVFDGGTRFSGWSRARGNYSAGVFLLNGYVDLGNWYGITPFVGGGVGVAVNNTSGFDGSTLVESPFPGSSGGGTFRRKTHETFAWALHAGLAYDVTPNFKVELGYRYLNLGDARTGLTDCFGCGQPPHPGVRIKDIESHDIKIGMRWALGGPTAYESAPLMRKY